MLSFRSWRRALLAGALGGVLSVVVPPLPSSAATPTPASAFLVTGTSGSDLFLAGYVMDGTGAGVASAPVRLTRSTSAATTTVVTTTTDANGLVFAAVTPPATSATYRLLAGDDVVAMASVGNSPTVATPAPPVGETRFVNLSGYRDLEVDDVHQRIYVSTGTNVRTFDLDGNAGTTIPVLGGAGHLALSPDQTTLFVALDQVGYIAVVDTATLAVVGNLRLPPGAGGANGFFGLELVGPKLAAGLTGDGQWSGGMAVVPLGNPRAASVVTGVYPGLLGASPATDEVAIFGNTSGISTSFWDVSGPEPVAVNKPFPAATSSSYPHDLDYAPDGQTVLLTAGAPYNARRATAAGGEVVATYPIGAYAASVTQSRDGKAVATSRYAYGPALRTFDAATGTLIAELPAGGDGTFSEYASGDGLAFSSDGSRLYAVHSPYNGQARLEVWPNPLVACTAELSATRNLDGSVRLEASVTSKGAPIPGGVVTFTRAGSATPVATVPLSDDGEATATAVLPPWDADEVRVSAQLPVGRPCVATGTVTDRGPSAPETVLAFGAEGAMVAFWSTPTDPGSSALVAQSVLVLQDGAVVRWVNVSPSAWYQVFYDLPAGFYEVLVVGWNSQRAGMLSAYVGVQVT